MEHPVEHSLCTLVEKSFSISETPTDMYRMGNICIGRQKSLHTLYLHTFVLR